MRFKTRRIYGSSADTDMTPMIDMCFQLIAFFMIVINFSEAEQNLDVRVPASELAKPPEESFEHSLTLQMKRDGDVIFGGKHYSMGDIGEALRIQAVVMERIRQDKTKTTVVIRADREARAGQVQQLIKKCQDLGFERFALKARQEQTSG